MLKGTLYNDHQYHNVPLRITSCALIGVHTYDRANASGNSIPRVLLLQYIGATSILARQGHID